MTAVEWLINEISSIDWENSYWKKRLEQAKEMEKQQIEHSFKQGFISSGYTEFDEYYNETFKKK